jgi:hypothetical protein
VPLFGGCDQELIYEIEVHSVPYRWSDRVRH